MILVVGRGSLGTLVARLLRQRGEDVRLTAGRAPSRALVARASVVLLAVADPAIAPTASRIAPWLAPRSVVLHAAGGRTLADLAPARAQGASIGVMHPLVSFARGAKPKGFTDTTFVVSGDPAALRAARALAKALGARCLEADVHGAAYHAAAAIAANGAVALIHAAAELLVSLGFRRADAERGLAGLVGTVVDNVRAVGVPEALTGPIARGDAAAVKGHRDALRAHPRALEVYDAIVPAILATATARGLSPDEAASIEAAITRPRRRASARSGSPRPRRGSAARSRA